MAIPLSASGTVYLQSCSNPEHRFTSSPGLCAMRTQTSPWSTTRTSLAMPSGLRLRSSLSGSGKTSLNWSQTSNWSHLQQLKQRKERTWRKRVGVEPTPESAKDTGYGFEDHEDHRALCASASSIEEVSARAQGGPSQTLKRAARRARKRGWCE